MAKVYSGVDGIEAPEFDWKNPDAYEAKEKKFLEDLKANLVARNPNGKNVGEVISFPVADGNARYMVAGMKPVELIHLALDDAYQYPDVALYTAKLVQEKINQRIALEKLFASRG